MNIFDRISPGDRVLRVTAQELGDLLRDMLPPIDRPPQPPVRKRSTYSERGLFTRVDADSIEWDTQCPDYLRRLAEWRASRRIPTKLQFYGPYGLLDIEIIEEIK